MAALSSLVTSELLDVLSGGGTGDSKGGPAGAYAKAVSVDEHVVAETWTDSLT